MFSENKPKAWRLYRAYISNSKGLGKEEVYDSASQGILGNNEFIKRVMKQRSGKGIKPRRRKEYSLADIAGGVKRKFGISLEQLRGENKSEPVSLGRKIITLIAEEYGYKRKEIAEFMEKDTAVVTRYLREKQNLALEMESVMKILSEESKPMNVKSQV